MSEEKKEPKKVNRNSIPVAFTLDEERRAFIDREAHRRRLNRSEWLRRIIDDLMAQEAAEQVEKPS